VLITRDAVLSQRISAYSSCSLSPGALADHLAVRAVISLQVSLSKKQASVHSRNGSSDTHAALSFYQEKISPITSSTDSFVAPSGQSPSDPRRKSASQSPNYPLLPALESKNPSSSWMLRDAELGVTSGGASRATPYSSREDVMFPRLDRLRRGYTGESISLPPPAMQHRQS
jgi:hypothetical protein